MSNRVVVVGAGADAVRVAAVLALVGRPVTLVLAEPPVASDLACRDRTSWRAARADTSLVDAVLGPTVAARPVECAVIGDRAVQSLPLSRWAVRKLIPEAERKVAARDWARARARNALAVVVGGGQEERTYADWVSRRMGYVALHRMYADYALRRWGRAPDALAASVARMAHGVGKNDVRVSPAAPTGFGVQVAQDALQKAGCERVQGVPRRFVVRQGRVVSVDFADGGSVPVTGELWCTFPPQEIARLLAEDCPGEVRHIAEAVASVPAHRIRLSGAVAGADEVHGLDPAPAWRWIRSPDDPSSWLVSVTGGACDNDLTEDVLDYSRQVGLVDQTGKVVSCASVPGGVPSTGPVDLARMRTIVEGLSPLGIRVAGPAGLGAELDAPEVVAHATALATGAAPLEAWRRHACPPAAEDDLEAHITSFLRTHG